TVGATTTTTVGATTTTTVGATTTTTVGATTTTTVGATTTTTVGATTTTTLGATTTTAPGSTTTTTPGSTTTTIVVSTTTTTATVAAPDGFPRCEHAACVPCGNANASCAGIPGCEVAGNPNGCIPRGTQGCCDQPGFVVPTFFVNILGGLCSRVDQIGCGTGVVNTSSPQTGDNEVDKKADTSDPGPDCVYGTADDPAAKPCTLAGAGADYNGKIVETVGDGNPDADGIHFRLVTPELSTTWTDGQSPSGTCASGSTFDDGELLVSQIVIKAEPTSAGASGSFADLNGDGCKRAGTGFTAALPDGPITVPG